ncbi:MAG: YdcF family protein [Polyangiaceae bacterium]
MRRNVLLQGSSASSIRTVFFVLSKILDLFVAPLTWALGCALAAAWGSRRGRMLVARIGSVGAAAILYGCSLPSVTNLFTRSMESSAVSTMSADTVYDVVVVLGGMLGDRSTVGVPEYNEKAERILAGFDVIHRNHARFILISDVFEGEILGRQLTDWGIDPDRVVLERRSRNTHENAQFSTEIIRQRRWSKILLVTSAMHMKRAAGCFQAEGIVPDTLPVDHVTSKDPPWFRNFDPRADNLSLTTAALREATGRLVYWVAGYSR